MFMIALVKTKQTDTYRKQGVFRKPGVSNGKGNPVHEKQLSAGVTTIETKVVLRRDFFLLLF